MSKKIKRVNGTIKIIKAPSGKDFTVKSGPNVGKPFKVFSSGILLIEEEGENWYNVKGYTEEKVMEQLNSPKLNRPYRVGDKVEFFLEAEDDAGKYFKIIQIAPFDSMITEEDVNEDNPIPIEDLDEGTFKPSIPTTKKLDHLPISGPDQSLLNTAFICAAIIVGDKFSKEDNNWEEDNWQEVFEEMVANIYKSKIKLE